MTAVFRARMAEVRDLTDDAVDNLSGHASTRFKLLDVRSDDERNKRLPPPSTTPIPLQELARRAPEEFSRDAHLIVFGTDDEETAEAEDILLSLGFTSVSAYRGGFAILARTFSWR